MNNYNGITKPLKITRGQSSNIDAKYGPYKDVITAINSNPINSRSIGLTVGIITTKGIEEYWWKEGTSNDHLVEKSVKRGTVESISQLRQYKVRTGEAVDVLGYYESGDGGGGTFYWDAASTETENGGTIIEANGVGNGRWKRRYEGAVNVKWFGAKEAEDMETFVGFDNREAFQAAFNLQGEIIVPKGDYLTSHDIKVKSNSKISLGNSTIKVFPMDLLSYRIFDIENVEDVVIEDGKLIGDVDNHLGTEGEWGMGIRTRGANRVLLRNLNLSKFWGDGIYLGGEEDGPYSENITVSNVVADRNRRQGMSIVRAKNVLVENSTFSNTSGHSPMAGIDIEPNNGDITENITIRDCFFIGNEGCGIDVITPGDNNTKEVRNITIDGCKVFNNTYGIRIRSNITPVGVGVHSVKVLNSHVENNLLKQFHIYRSKDVVIQNSKIISNETDPAFSVFRTEGLRIDSNDITGKFGIFIRSLFNGAVIYGNKISTEEEAIYDDGDTNPKTRNRISFNEIQSVNSVGIRLIALEESVISENIIKNTGLDGIYLSTTRTSKIISNHIESIGLIDSEESLAYIRIEGRSRNNIISGNSIVSLIQTTNSYTGIILDNGTRKNSVFGNIFNFFKSVSLKQKIEDLSPSTNFIQITDEYNVGPTSQRPEPSQITTGYSYFDTSKHIRLDWDGDKWIDLSEDSENNSVNRLNMTPGVENTDLKNIHPYDVYNRTLSAIQFDSARPGIANYPNGRGVIIQYTDPNQNSKLFLALTYGEDASVSVAKLDSEGNLTDWSPLLTNYLLQEKARTFTAKQKFQSIEVPTAQENNEAVNLGQIRLSGVTGNRPTNNLYIGLQFFDTSLGYTIWYNGTDWVDATGTTV